MADTRADMPLACPQNNCRQPTGFSSSTGKRAGRFSFGRQRSHLWKWPEEEVMSSDIMMNRVPHRCNYDIAVVIVAVWSEYLSSLEDKETVTC